MSAERPIFAGERPQKLPVFRVSTRKGREYRPLADFSVRGGSTAYAAVWRLRGIVSASLEGRM